MSRASNNYPLNTTTKKPQSNKLHSSHHSSFFPYDLPLPTSCLSAFVPQSILKNNDTRQLSTIMNQVLIRTISPTWFQQETQENKTRLLNLLQMTVCYNEYGLKYRNNVKELLHEEIAKKEKEAEEVKMRVKEARKKCEGLKDEEVVKRKSLKEYREYLEELHKCGECGRYVKDVKTHQMKHAEIEREILKQTEKQQMRFKTQYQQKMQYLSKQQSDHKLLLQRLTQQNLQLQNKLKKQSEEMVKSRQEEIIQRQKQESFKKISKQIDDLKNQLLIFQSQKEIQNQRKNQGIEGLQELIDKKLQQHFKKQQQQQQQQQLQSPKKTPEKPREDKKPSPQSKKSLHSSANVNLVQYNSIKRTVSTKTEQKRNQQKSESESSIIKTSQPNIKTSGSILNPIKILTYDEKSELTQKNEDDEESPRIDISSTGEMDAVENQTKAPGLATIKEYGNETKMPDWFGRDKVQNENRRYSDIQRKESRTSYVKTEKEESEEANEYGDQQFQEDEGGEEEINRAVPSNPKIEEKKEEEMNGYNFTASQLKNEPLQYSVSIVNVPSSPKDESLALKSNLNDDRKSPQQLVYSYRDSEIYGSQPTNPRESDNSNAQVKKQQQTNSFLPIRSTSPTPSQDPSRSPRESLSNTLNNLQQEDNGILLGSTPYGYSSASYKSQIPNAVPDIKQAEPISQTIQQVDEKGEKSFSILSSGVIPKTQEFISLPKEKQSPVGTKSKLPPFPEQQLGFKEQISRTYEDIYKMPYRKIQEPSRAEIQIQLQEIEKKLKLQEKEMGVYKDTIKMIESEGNSGEFHADLESRGEQEIQYRYEPEKYNVSMVLSSSIPLAQEKDAITNSNTKLNKADAQEKNQQSNPSEKQSANGLYRPPALFDSMKVSNNLRGLKTKPVLKPSEHDIVKRQIEKYNSDVEDFEHFQDQYQSIEGSF